MPAFPEDPADEGPTWPAERRRVDRAIHELTGDVEPWRHRSRLIERYLGPWLGMDHAARWHALTCSELVLLAEAIEERVAIAVDGASRAERTHVPHRA